MAKEHSKKNAYRSRAGKTYLGEPQDTARPAFDYAFTWFELDSGVLRDHLEGRLHLLPTSGEEPRLPPGLDDVVIVGDPLAQIPTGEKSKRERIAKAAKLSWTSVADYDILHVAVPRMELRGHTLEGIIRRIIDVQPDEQLGEPLDASLPTLARLSKIATQSLEADLARIEPSFTSEKLGQRIGHFKSALRELQSPIRTQIVDFLRGLNALPEEDRTLKSLDANVEFTKELQRIISTIDERLRCPKCKEPGTIVCKKSKALHGSFQFRHTESGLHRSCGSWRRIPILRLMSARRAVR